MAKKLIQDIVVKKTGINFFNKNLSKKPEAEEPAIKLSINNISSEKHTHARHHKHHEEKVSKNSHIILWIVCIITVATLLFMLMSTFASATITIIPKDKLLTMNDTYSMNAKKGIDGLYYQVINLKRDISKSITSDSEENVERKATGKAILYNNFSTSNQRLITNTRLQSVDGLIYRIRQSVDIPGIKTINGVKTPGSVEVDIIADVAGDKYNMKLSDFKGDFKIPGFKDSAKYNGFYGRLSSDLTGGYIGKVKSVSDQVLSANRNELKNTLSEGLIKDIYLQKPEQYYIFKDSYFIQFTDLPDVSGEKDYTISESATIYAIIFDKSELSTFIAENKIKGFDGSKVDVLWKDNIQATISGVTAKPWTESSLKIKLAGDADIVWSYDKDEIISEIIGKNKSVIKDILNTNKDSIVGINAVINPRWKQTFPSNIKKIKLIDSVRDTL